MPAAPSTDGFSLSVGEISSSPSAAARATKGLRGLLPAGNQLDPRVWERRHHAIVIVALAQSLLVFGFGLWRSVPAPHAFAECLAVAVLAGGARSTALPRSVRSGLATLSLITASAMLVHQAAGVTEWHFHFFVMIGLITLYQDWSPFLVAVAFVVLHHGALGSLDPEGVYGTPEAIRAPWRWALLHGIFVLCASAVHVAAWRLSEAQQNTDQLTGLPNRLGFSDLIDHELARSSGSIAVLHLDVDGFKAVNENLGHVAGDEVLRRLASCLRDAVRPADRIARLGGDEFGLLLPDCEELGAEGVLERMRADTSPVCWSVGVAPLEGGGETAEVLVQRADEALYRAKARAARAPT